MDILRHASRHDVRTFEDLRRPSQRLNFPKFEQHLDEKTRHRGRLAIIHSDIHAEPSSLSKLRESRKLG